MSFNVGMPPLSLQIALEGGLMDAINESSRVSAIRELRAAAFRGAEFVRGTWLSVAQMMDIRGRNRDEMTYIQGIRSASITVESFLETPTRAEIVIAIRNSSPHAAIVEEGHAPFSLPDAINWSSTRGSIKRGANGPYLHIPFRHTAPASEAQMVDKGYTYGARKAMMPREVYQEAKQLHQRVPMRAGPIYGPAQISYTGGVAHARRGQFLAADRYRWQGPGSGYRVDRSSSRPHIAVGPGGAASDEHRSARHVGTDRRGNVLHNPAWQHNKYDSLFKAGDKGHTAYMTIRTLTPDSLGWNIPAQPGRHVARRVAHVLQYGQAAQQLAEIISGPILGALRIDTGGPGGQ